MLHRALVIAPLLLPVVALSSVAATNFQDIPAGHWARRAAIVLAEHQIMPGRTPVDFAGDAPLTRYELAWALSHLYNVDGPPAMFEVLSDMPPGHFATLEVQRVMGYGLLPPHKPGHFDGDVPASRREVVESLDTLLNKDGVRPPARKTAITFPDVPAGKPFGMAVDRIVNQYALVEARPGVKFNPDDSIGRYQFLAMLIRAVRYLQPQLIKELAEPTPAPSLPPGVSPTPTLAPGATPQPTPTPMPSGQVLRSKAILQGEVLGFYDEAIPTDTGLAVTGEQREESGVGLPGAGARFEYWNGGWGVTMGLSSYYIGLDIPATATTRATPANLLDTTIRVDGMYQLLGSPDFQLAAGLAAIYRKVYNTTASGALYTSADKTYLGGGLAGEFGWRIVGPLALVGQLDVYPMDQSYILTTGNVDVTRVGIDPQLRLEYTFGDTWLATLGTSSLINVGGGGFQALIGFNLGLGKEF